MSKQTLTGTTRMEPNGRVMIPVAIRKRLGFEPGVGLVISVNKDQIVIEDKMKAWRELQTYFTKAYKGKKLLSEELMEDRRKEAIREGYA